jgi:3-demethoxyubiquinol 3-hydroxylase
MSVDFLILQFDRALRTLAAPARTQRQLPGGELPDCDLSVEENRHVNGLMRVNHCGEVCAQALYQGQALTSRDAGVRDALRLAADEETEHLAWTERRLAELGGHTSFLNPLWYFGSLTLGVTAGVLGDKWNLGFLAETERQVEAHLDGHLRELPAKDARSRAIVDQMRRDEIAHAKMAVSHGAAELPPPVRFAMRAVAKVMTGVAYRI